MISKKNDKNGYQYQNGHENPKADKGFIFFGERH
jgi:hypothetical protein